MKHQLRLATLSLMALFSENLAAAFDDGPPPTGSNDARGTARIVPGVRVRVKTADVVEIPGLVRIDQQRAEGHGVTFDEPSQTVTLRAQGGDARSGVAILPRPHATFIGEVIAADDGTLLIRLDGKPVQVTIPRAAIHELDVSLGWSKRRGRGRSALLGMAIGGGAGAFLGFASGDDQCTPHGRDSFEALFSCLLTFTAGQKAIAAGVTLGFVGGIAGALVGGGRTERWDDVARSGASKVKVALLPIGRSGLSVRIGF